jgi:hypothetical protein
MIPEITMPRTSVEERGFSPASAPINNIVIPSEEDRSHRERSSQSRDLEFGGRIVIPDATVGERAFRPA